MMIPHRSASEELRALRERYAGLDDAVALAEDAAALAAQCDLQALKLQSEGSYPTAGGQFFSALPQIVTGPEKEGATPVFADAAAAFYPYVPGASAPTVGAKLVAGLVPYRWVTERPRAVPPPPTTTVTGQLIACIDGAGTPGSATVTRTATGAVLGTAATDASGNFRVAFSLSSDTQCTVVATPASNRLQPTPPSTFTVRAGQTNVVPTLNNTGQVLAQPAAGYHCILTCSNIPLTDTLYFTAQGGADCSFAWPDDVLTYQNPGPHGAVGWFGAQQIDFGTIGLYQGPGRYWLDNQLNFALISDTNGAIGGGFNVNRSSLSCPPTFLAQYACQPGGGGLFLSIGGTLSE